MIRFILKRVAHAVPLLVAITLVIFILVDAMPGNELTAYLGSFPEDAPRPSQEQIRQMMEVLQYNRPWHQRYFQWLGDALQGDFGTSLHYRRPVSDIVGTLIWRTFFLNLIALIMTFIIAIPIGVRTASRKGGIIDQFFTLAGLILVSVPSFFIGIYLMRLLAVNVSWIPPTGMRSIIGIVKGYPSKTAELLDIARHTLLPALTLTLVGFGSVARFVRNAVVDVINQDYIRTAKSKGLSQRIVLYRHAFRNALVPVISLLGVMIPSLFVGNIFVEAVFNWPGIGLEFIESVYRRDAAMISFIILFFSVATILGNLVADILYGVVDPRIHVE